MSNDALTGACSTRARIVSSACSDAVMREQQHGAIEIGIDDVAATSAINARASVSGRQNP